MTTSARLAEWLGIRPGELGVVALSFAGAFLVMSFLVLSSALREATYLSAFDASTLPYAIGGVVLVGLIGAVVFGRVLERVDARRAMKALTLLFAVAVAATWPFLEESATAVVVFYLLTAAGTVLLTSTFWLVVSDLLVVREAKRLFGLISGGGTLGVLVTGLAVGAAVERWEPELLVPVLVGLLLATAGLNEFVPRKRLSTHRTGATTGWLASGTLIARTPHVRTLTLIVLLVAALGTVVGFQFQEAAQDALADKRALASYFGAFYGWTGGLALAVQLLLTTRIMSRGGVGWSLALMPLLVLILSAGMLVAPGLAFATAMRGTDSTLKKSVFRSVVEFLWVPVRPDVRRRTKTFVDTTAENAGDGLGALLVLLLVTLGGLPSRYLSIVVALLCITILWLARRMGLAYVSTLRTRLEEGSSGPAMAGQGDGPQIAPPTLSRLDVTRLLSSIDREDRSRDLSTIRRPASDSPPAGTGGASKGDVWTMATALDDDTLRGHLDAEDGPHTEDARALALLLARDGVRDSAARRLLALGEAASAELASILADSTADFVVRRRVAPVLGQIPGPAALEGILAGLEASRFEVRYRSARALSDRLRGEPGSASGEVAAAVWRSIRQELSRGRAVWELAHLLDAAAHDELAGGRAAEREELSLEHVFRLLSLVLDRQAIHASWRGILGDDDDLASLSLEYLEQVLPDDVRVGLWPFIGDLSAEQSRRAIRPLDVVINDLLVSGATLFRPDDRRELRDFLSPKDGEAE